MTPPIDRLEKLSSLLDDMQTTGKSFEEAVKDLSDEDRDMLYSLLQKEKKRRKGSANAKPKNFEAARKKKQKAQKLSRKKNR